MKLFQSYLVLGRQEARRRAKTGEITKVLGCSLSKNSPDILMVTPQKNSVTIDQVRELKKQIFQKPVAGKFRLAIIESAEKLTTEAQNALLKILEEPPLQAIIVLEAQDKWQLLPTILSRVVIKQAERGKERPLTFLLGEEEEMTRLLEKIAQIDNPQNWLDEQIIGLYGLLKDKLRNESNDATLAKIAVIIQKCLLTKQMIAANINPRFALANLIFSITLPTQ